MGKRTSPAVTAPWWWPAVEADVAPEVVAVARKLGLTAGSTSQRVWAILRMMVDPYFPTEPFKPLFPEIDVATVPLWDQRKVFAGALRDSLESSIAHAALEHLGARVREGTTPALPRRRSTPSLARDWPVLFSRSTQGPDTFFIRGTRRSHAGLDSFKTRYEHACFKAVIDICDRYDVVRAAYWTGSPANASTYENYAVFLDGGVKSIAGDYIGVHGAWIVGHAAMRFVALELGVPPSRWPAALGTAPSHRDLVRDLLLQLASDLPALNGRLNELRAL
jgi:hypothetical protein